MTGTAGLLGGLVLLGTGTAAAQAASVSASSKARVGEVNNPDFTIEEEESTPMEVFLTKPTF